MPNPWTPARPSCSRRGVRGPGDDERRLAWSLGRLDCRRRATSSSPMCGRRGGDAVPLNVDSEPASRTSRAASPRRCACSPMRAPPAARSRTWIPRPARSTTSTSPPSASPRPRPRPTSSGIVLTGRAENHIHGVDDLDDTIARLAAYRDAGADCLYAPGLADLEPITAGGREVGAPVNVLALPSGPSVAGARRRRRPPRLERAVRWRDPAYGASAEGRRRAPRRWERLAYSRAGAPAEVLRAAVERGYTSPREHGDRTGAVGRRNAQGGWQLPGLRRADPGARRALARPDQGRGGPRERRARAARRREG